jgi:hypothetical protein
LSKSAAKRETIRETVREVERDPDDDAGDTEDAEDQHLEAPLFSPLMRRAKRIEVVAVRRTEPDSGYLGTMPPDVTEATLKTRWGGGSYRLEGKNASGQILAGCVRTLKLAGDPIFAGDAEEMEWRRAHGLKARAAADAPPTESIKDLIMLLEQRDEKRRAELTEREEKRRAEAVEREERARQETAAREERARKELEDRLAIERQQREERERAQLKESDDREERRRNQAREDDERRSRQHREDMERMALTNQQTLQQSQAFYQQLAQVMKVEGGGRGDDPVKTLIAGVELARSLGPGGGGGDSDEGPLTTMAKRLPEILAEARRTGAAALAEIRNSGRGGAAPVANPEAITLTGPVALKARKVLAAMAKQGKNPEEEIDKLLTFAAASMGADVSTPAAPAPRKKPAAATRPAATTKPTTRPRVTAPARRRARPPGIIKRRA